MIPPLLWKRKKKAIWVKSKEELWINILSQKNNDLNIDYRGFNLMSGSTVNADANNEVENEKEDILQELNEKLQHSYAQSLAGEGRPLEDVFDDLER